MKTEEAKQVIAQAFAALSDEQRGNLRWHAENGTRVLCGAGYEGDFHGDDGQSAPSVLAVYREPATPFHINDGGEYNRAMLPAMAAYWHMGGSQYDKALEVITEPALRELMRAA